MSDVNMASSSPMTTKADDSGDVIPADRSEDGATKTGDSVKTTGTDDPELNALLDSKIFSFL